MNIKSNITLYKTPIDSEYRNVYDDYATQSDYVAFLENFEHTSVSLATGQRTYSIKNTNENFDLTIYGYNVDTISQYNYLSFLTSNNKVYFAFILSIDSKNDSVINATVTVHCKLDAWSNNYLTLRNSGVGGPDLINTTRATINTYAMPNMPTPLKNASITPKKKILRFIQSGSDKYVIIWQRLVLKDGITGVSVEGKQLVGDIGTGSGLVIYRPAGILKCVNNVFEFVGNNKRLRLTYNISSVGTETHDYIAYGFPAIAPVKSSFVMSNTLCYTVPFRYMFVNETDTILNFRIYDGSIIKTCSTVGEDMQCATTTIVAEHDITVYGLWFTVINYTDQYTTDGWRIKTTVINGKHPAVTDTPPYTGIAKYYVVNKSILSQEYPFHYYSVYVGDKEVPLIGYNGNKFVDNSIPDFPANYTPSYSQTPIPGCKTTISYEYAGKLGACLLISNEGIDDFIRIPIETKNEMDIVLSAYDEYMMRNQASYTLNMASGIVSSLMGVGTSLATGNYVGAATGAISGTMSVLGQMASLEDKKNTASSIKGNGLYPQTSPYQLDLLVLVENSIPNDDLGNSIEGNLIYDYHINGQELAISYPLIYIAHCLYDYCQGNAILALIASETDKKEIVSAFSRGIRRFHINTATQKNVKFKYLLDCDFRFVNYPLSILP